MIQLTDLTFRSNFCGNIYCNMGHFVTAVMNACIFKGFSNDNSHHRNGGWSACGITTDSSPVVFLYLSLVARGGVMGRKKAKERDDWEILCRKVVRDRFSLI